MARGSCFHLLVNDFNIGHIVDKISDKFFSKYRFVFLIYFAISFLIFLKLFLSKGSLVGSDWGFPDNFSGMDVFFRSLLHSWTRIGNFFGTRQLSPVSIIFISPMYLLAFFGVSVSFIIKMLMVLIFAFAGANFNLLARYLKLKSLPSFIGGLAFILSPVFFNYSLIGWIYVLVSLAMLPLFVYLILRSIDERNYRLIFIAAIVFSLAVVQSQTIIWYPLVSFAITFSYGILTKRFWLSLKYSFLLIVIFLLLNSYWIPSMVLFPDQGAVGGDMVQSTISLGTSLRLSSFNILRAWGSLYNYQFETSYPSFMQFFAFAITLIGLSSLFFLRTYKKHISYLLLIFLIPAFFYLADREFISRLPFANLIRDVARFSVLSTFSLAMLTTIALDQFYSHKIKLLRVLFVVSVLILFINALPFWSGGLFSQPKLGFDFRLRTYVWPDEYQKLNSKLSSENTTQRAIFLPLGGLVSLTDDLRYNGPFHEIADVYSGFSPISAAVSFSDRSKGASSDLVEMIDQSIKDQDINKLKYLASVAKIQFIVIRRDMEYYDWSENEKTDFERKLKSLVDSGQATVYFDEGQIFAIKLNSKFPIIDAGTQLVQINSNISNILLEYFDSSIVSANQFKQIEEYQAISSFFPPETIFTFNQQNLMFSNFTFDQPSGYQFISLGQIREKALILKWTNYQQNLNPKIKNALKDKNLEVISFLEKAHLPEAGTNTYFFFSEHENKDSVILLSSDQSQTTSVKINEKILFAEPVSEGVLQIKLPSTGQGLNILEVDYPKMRPILLKTNTPDDSTPKPTIQYQKINSSEFIVKVSNAKNDFYLNFAENYNSLWRIYKSDGFLDKSLVDSKQHFVANGFGNGYKIEVNKMENLGVLNKQPDGSYSGEFRLIFWPEKIMLPGLIISLIALIIVIFFFFRRRKYIDGY